jgi:hypothetical protein
MGSLWSCIAHIERSVAAKWLSHVVPVAVCCSRFGVGRSRLCQIFGTVWNRFGLAARGNSNYFQKTTLALEHRRAQRRYNAFLAGGWSFESPPIVVKSQTVAGSYYYHGLLGRNGKCLKMWWPGTESNRRRQPFQGCALPTELPGRDQPNL